MVDTVIQKIFFALWLTGTVFLFYGVAPVYSSTFPTDLSEENSLNYNTSSYGDITKENFVSTPDDINRNIAVVVGVAEYKYGQDLGGPVNDADALTAFLQLNGWEVITLTDINADKESMKNSIISSIKKAEKFLFTFSGHGTTMESYQKGIILPYDASNADNSTYITEDELKLWLEGREDSEEKEVTGVKVGVIIDACYSGALINSRDDKFLYNTKNKNSYNLTNSENFQPNTIKIIKQIGNNYNENTSNTFFSFGLNRNLKTLATKPWTVIASSRDDQVSYDWGSFLCSSGENIQIYNGQLVYHLLVGMGAFNGCPDEPSNMYKNDINNDGNISMEEAFDFVESTLLYQTPKFYDGDISSEFLITSTSLPVCPENQCINIDETLTIALPCVIIDDKKYEFKLNSVGYSLSANIFLWEMDTNSFKSVEFSKDLPCPQDCMEITDDLSITIDCINIYGTMFSLKLDFFKSSKSSDSMWLLDLKNLKEL
ncbi:MAG: hypothetical protein B6I31_05350 [Desulfobacteraceae bacterium 4572_19]|nr:MAG: hypothetical protein B6I31_05350 [Desulfobacteraceae bacterium 4572_19]